MNVWTNWTRADYSRPRREGRLLGEIFRPEQFRRTDHPGRADFGTDPFYWWRSFSWGFALPARASRPPLQRRGILHIQHFFNSCTPCYDRPGFLGSLSEVVYEP